MSYALRISVAVVLAVTCAPAAAQCVSDADRERTRSIMLDGVDAALKDHTAKLFDNWLKDRGEQPGRAARGMRNGINAYVRARESVLKWSPPLCDR